MGKIYYIIYWYKHEIEGHLQCDRNGAPIVLTNRDAAFSYMEELKMKNPDYKYSLRSTRSEEEIKE